MDLTAPGDQLVARIVREEDGTCFNIGLNCAVGNAIEFCWLSAHEVSDAKADQHQDDWPKHQTADVGQALAAMVGQSPAAHGTELVSGGGGDARVVDCWREWIMLHPVFGVESMFVVVVGRDGSD